MSENPKVLDFLAKSRFAFKNGEFETSLNLAREALKLEKNDKEVYVAMGNALMSLERMDEGCKSYSWAVNCEPSNPNLLLQYGFALMSNDETAKGFEILSKAKEIISPPNAPVVTNEKDDLLTDEKLEDKQIKDFNSDSNDLLYTTLGLYCFDIGNFKDALNHFSQIKGVSLDVLRRKAIIYGIENNIREGLNTTNQIKLLNPSAYVGYQLAFGLLIQIAEQAGETTKNLISESEKTTDIAEKKALDEKIKNHIEIQNELLKRAKDELEKAKKFAIPEMDYYFDCLNFEISLFNNDKDPVHFTNALNIIDSGLNAIKVKPLQVIENYVNAAEIYLQLADNEKTSTSVETQAKYIKTAIECLNATSNPVFSYNHGFSILELNEPNDQETNKSVSLELNEQDSVSDDSIPVFAEENYDILNFAEENYDSLDFADEKEYTGNSFEEYPNSDSVLNSNIDFLSDVSNVPNFEQEEVYKISDIEKFECPEKLSDQINVLYVTAYTKLDDYKQVNSFAKLLKMSNITANAYMGRYTEVLALKELGQNVEEQYDELIKYFKRQSYLDQTDIQASFYLASCYIDTKQFEEAEKLCDILHKSFKEEIKAAIEEAKKQDK